MRFLLWLTLVCLCAISGDHVLAVLSALVLLGCVSDAPFTRRGRLTRSR